MNRISIRFGFLAAVGALVLTQAAAEIVGESSEEQSARHATRMRRPVALVLLDEGRRLYVANRRSGSISVIDVARGRVVDEVSVGKRLSDLAAIAAGHYLLATDEEAGELIVVRRDDACLQPIARVPVSPSPVQVVATEDGAACFVASLWPRVVTRVDLSWLKSDTPAADAQSIAQDVVPLPFSPRKLLLVRDGAALLVADSFGGKIGVVDPAQARLVSVRNLPGHNLRGWATSADGEHLFVSHQLLNRLAETTHNDVHWGVLLTNNLRRLRIDAVLSPDDALLEGSQMHFLGDPGNATGDPAAVAVTEQGTVVVALAGVDQVAIGEHLAASFHRVAVGRRPTSVVLGGDRRRGYVANTFSDSVSVIDLASASVETEISLGPQPDPDLVDRGEMLFYDARLSLDGWYSCHSCHTDGHTNGLLADNLGDGGFGAPKRVLSLLGTGETGPWAWNGKKPSLGEQIQVSIRSTMQGAEPTEGQVRALEAYLRSLKPLKGNSRLWATHDPESIARGQQVFRRQRCTGCHRQPSYTTQGTYDVGLDDGQGTKRFNPPSLRGVGHGGPFFHDNRATTLDEVFEQHRHGLRSALSEEDLHDLVAFLASL